MNVSKSLHRKTLAQDVLTEDDGVKTLIKISM